MPFWGELLIAAVLVVGLVGIVVPILPGTVLIAGALLVWAIVVGGWAWTVFAIALVILGVGEVIKYLAAGRSLRTSGIPNRTIVAGGLAGIVGFFVVPVVGLFLGFVVGAMASEFIRTRAFDQAWLGALAATRAAALTIGIELLAALTVSTLWLGSAFVW